MRSSSVARVLSIRSVSSSVSARSAAAPVPAAAGSAGSASRDADLRRSAVRRLSRARFTAIVEIHPRRLGRTIRGVRVVSRHALGGPKGVPLLVSVSGPEPRALIRGELARLGWRECVDFVCAA